jgi:hypothetical protein
MKGGGRGKAKHYALVAKGDLEKGKNAGCEEGYLFK